MRPYGGSPSSRCGPGAMGAWWAEVSGGFGGAGDGSGSGRIRVWVPRKQTAGAPSVPEAGLLAPSKHLCAACACLHICHAHTHTHIHTMHAHPKHTPHLCPTPHPPPQVPACYKHTPPRLQPGYLAKFKEETLFYIFYSMPQARASTNQAVAQPPPLHVLQHVVHTLPASSVLPFQPIHALHLALRERGARVACVWRVRRRPFRPASRNQQRRRALP